MSIDVDLNTPQASWASIEVRTDGEAPIVGILAVKYSDGIEETIVHAGRRQPIGRTRGKYKVDEVSITLLEWAARAITSQAGWMDRIRTIVVQYSEEGADTHTDVIEGVRFLGVDGGGEEGVDALKREIKCSALKIKRDGVYAINGMV